MKKITVHASKTYDIIIESGALRKIGGIVREMEQVKKVLIITDDNVDKLYAPAIEKPLKASGFSVSKYVFPSGECRKSLLTVSLALDELAKAKLDRNDLIIALGGGVVGDLAGFTAGIYMRGIRYIHVPTTLMAAIDSSVGGKTGVNLNAGKNLAGLFYHPEVVLFDTDTLDSLPKKELLNGIGEGIKYAVLKGGELFNLMMGGLGGNTLERFIELCIYAKIEIVEKDEREADTRRLLNLGHTIAHAIEKKSQYTVPHGIAVASGIEIMAKSCKNLGFLREEHYLKIMKLLEKYSLAGICKYKTRDLVAEMLYDKKRAGDSIILTTINGIGECSLLAFPLEGLGDFFI